MEEPPTLKVHILQGPRQGETLEFRPGSAIRIGRVVRGNTLPIKDPGISTKHLSVLTESGNWVLRDLDSSNGTVLDDIKIPPNTPFPLRDGSTIKIGEVTSILITFLLHHQQNPTRSAPTGSVTVLEPGPETEGPAAPVAKPVRGRRGRGRVPVQSIDENATVNESGYVDRPAPTRVTRNSKNTRSVTAGNLDATDEKVERPKKTRATRNTKNKRNVIEISDLHIGNSDAPEDKVEEPKNTRVPRNTKNKQSVVEISDSSIGNSDAPKEKVEEPKNARVTRNSKNKQGVVEISDSVTGNSDAPKEKVEEPKNTRVTRNSKNKGSVIGENSNLECGVENVERKKTRGGARGRKLQEECAGDGGKETCDGREKENVSGDVNWPDLEKLSLGEWLDFLEVYLPKQIIDATEEMFDSMRQKAERLREYIIMQENHKLEVPVE